MLRKKKIIITISVVILGLIALSIYRRYSYKDYLPKELFDMAMDNASEFDGKTRNRNDQVIKHTIDNSIPLKQNYLNFLKKSNCIYYTEKDNISLYTLIDMTNDYAKLPSWKKKSLCHTISIGSRFSIGGYDVEFYASEAFRGNDYSFFEIIYTDGNEIVFSRVLRYGGIVGGDTSFTGEYVEQLFKDYMGID